MLPSLRPLLRLSHAIRDWPVASQQHSRRNAMVALTACARRRADREEVARYLSERSARRVVTSSHATVRPAVHG